MQHLCLILALKLCLMHFRNTLSIGVATQSKRLRCFGFISHRNLSPYPCFVKQRIHTLKREKDIASKFNYLLLSPSSIHESVLSCQYDQRQSIQRQRGRQAISFIPEPYNSLPIGEIFRPVPDLAPNLIVERLAWSPDIFLVRKFLPLQSERKSLVEEASQCQVSIAETTFGLTSKRRGSNVWWINDEQSLHHHHHQRHSNKFAPTGRNVAHYMSNLSAHLFLSLTSVPPPVRPLIANNIKKERLQLVQYEPGGAFDLHHDGQNRFLTVLTYLNGVAGTWFPFAQSSRSPTTTSEAFDCRISVEDKLILQNGETPGRDGLLIVGSEHGRQFYAQDKCNQERMREGGDYNLNLREGNNERCSAATTSNDNSSAVVHIQPGDAVIFFNYDFLFQEKKGEMSTLVPNWRAIHAALPTRKEKWIATNWFSYHPEK